MLSEISFFICSQLFILLSQSAQFLHNFSTACGKHIAQFSILREPTDSNDGCGRLSCIPAPCCGNVSLAQLGVRATINFRTVIRLVFNYLHKTVSFANVGIRTRHPCNVLMNYACGRIEAIGPSKEKSFDSFEDGARQ